MEKEPEMRLQTLHQIFQTRQPIKSIFWELITAIVIRSKYLLLGKCLFVFGSVYLVFKCMQLVFIWEYVFGVQIFDTWWCVFSIWECVFYRTWISFGSYCLVSMCSMWVYVGLAKVHCCATPPFVMVLFGTVYLCLRVCIWYLGVCFEFGSSIWKTAKSIYCA